MKLPKLKHSVLCQILLYVPTLSLFAWLALMAVILGAEEKMNTVGVIGVFAFSAFSLWYLFHNFALLMLSDVLFSSIRQWKADRTEYRTQRNGLGREPIRKAILLRCALWGRRSDAPQGTVRAEVYYRHCYSWTVFWSAIEKRVAVCTVDTLTPENYRILVRQLRQTLNTVPDGKIRFKTGSERRAPRCRAYAIILMANSVEDEVKTLARKAIVKEDGLCLLPCVVQCSDGKYYVNFNTDYHEPGTTGRPAESYAAAMLRKLVFSGRLPKENAATQPEPDFRFDLDMSLWEYCRTIRSEVHGQKDELEKERMKAYQQLRSGETRVGEGIIWYKRGECLAEYAFIPDDEDETLVTLITDEVWYYKKETDIVSSVMVTGKLNRRKMKKGEPEQVLRCMRAAFLAEGYRINEE